MVVKLDGNCTGSTDADARLKYIGKQMDFETNLADHVVRKYDNSLGQFTSIDPLWEKYYGWTPYHYCRNNPLIRTDGNGFVDGDGFEIFQSEMIRIGQYDEFQDACQRYVPGALMITAGILGTVTGIGAAATGPLTTGGAALIGIDLTSSIYSISAGTAIEIANLSGNNDEASKIPGSLPGVVGKFVDQAAGINVFEKVLDIGAGVSDLARSLPNITKSAGNNVKEFALFTFNTGGLIISAPDFLKNIMNNTTETKPQTDEVKNKKQNIGNHNSKPSSLKISTQP